MVPDDFTWRDILSKKKEEDAKAVDPLAAYVPSAFKKMETAELARIDPLADYVPGNMREREEGMVLEEDEPIPELVPYKSEMMDALSSARDSFGLSGFDDLLDPYTPKESDAPMWMKVASEIYPYTAKPVVAAAGVVLRSAMYLFGTILDTPLAGLVNGVENGIAKSINEDSGAFSSTMNIIQSIGMAYWNKIKDIATFEVTDTEYGGAGFGRIVHAIRSSNGVYTDKVREIRDEIDKMDKEYKDGKYTTLKDVSWYHQYRNTLIGELDRTIKLEKGKVDELNRTEGSIGWRVTADIVGSLGSYVAIGASGVVTKTLAGKTIVAIAKSGGDVAEEIAKNPKLVKELRAVFSQLESKGVSVDEGLKNLDAEPLRKFAKWMQTADELNDSHLSSGMNEVIFDAFRRAKARTEKIIGRKLTTDAAPDAITSSGNVRGTTGRDAVSSAVGKAIGSTEPIDAEKAVFVWNLIDEMKSVFRVTDEASFGKASDAMRRHLVSGTEFLVAESPFGVAEWAFSQASKLPGFKYIRNLSLAGDVALGTKVVKDEAGRSVGRMLAYGDTMGIPNVFPVKVQTAESISKYMDEAKLRKADATRYVRAIEEGKKSAITAEELEYISRPEIQRMIRAESRMKTEDIALRLAIQDGVQQNWFNSGFNHLLYYSFARGVGSKGFAKRLSKAYLERVAQRSESAVTEVDHYFIHLEKQIDKEATRLASENPGTSKDDWHTMLSDSLREIVETRFSERVRVGDAAFVDSYDSARKVMSRIESDAKNGIATTTEPIDIVVEREAMTNGAVSRQEFDEMANESLNRLTIEELGLKSSATAREVASARAAMTDTAWAFYARSMAETEMDVRNIGDIAKVAITKDGPLINISYKMTNRRLAEILGDESIGDIAITAEQHEDILRGELSMSKLFEEEIGRRLGNVMTDQDFKKILDDAKRVGMQDARDIINSLPDTMRNMRYRLANKIEQQMINDEPVFVGSVKTRGNEEVSIDEFGRTYTDDKQAAKNSRWVSDPSQAKDKAVAKNLALAVSRIKSGEKFRPRKVGHNMPPESAYMTKEEYGEYRSLQSSAKTLIDARNKNLITKTQGEKLVEITNRMQEISDAAKAKMARYHVTDEIDKMRANLSKAIDEDGPVSIRKDYVAGKSDPHTKYMTDEEFVQYKELMDRWDFMRKVLAKTKEAREEATKSIKAEMAKGAIYSDEEIVAEAERRASRTSGYDKEIEKKMQDLHADITEIRDRTSNVSRKLAFPISDIIVDDKGTVWYQIADKKVAERCVDNQEIMVSGKYLTGRTADEIIDIEKQRLAKAGRDVRSANFEESPTGNMVVTVESAASLKREKMNIVEVHDKYCTTTRGDTTIYQANVDDLSGNTVAWSVKKDGKTDVVVCDINGSILEAETKEFESKLLAKMESGKRMSRENAVWSVLGINKDDTFKADFALRSGTIKGERGEKVVLVSSNYLERTLGRNTHKGPAVHGGDVRDVVPVKQMPVNATENLFSVIGKDLYVIDGKLYVAEDVVGNVMTVKRISENAGEFQAKLNKVAYRIFGKTEDLGNMYADVECANSILNSMPDEIYNSMVVRGVTIRLVDSEDGIKRLLSSPLRKNVVSIRGKAIFDSSSNELFITRATALDNPREAMKIYAISMLPEIGVSSEAYRIMKKRMLHEGREIADKVFKNATKKSHIARIKNAMEGDSIERIEELYQDIAKAKIGAGFGSKPDELAWVIACINFQRQQRHLPMFRQDVYFMHRMDIDILKDAFESYKNVDVIHWVLSQKVKRYPHQLIRAMIKDFPGSGTDDQIRAVLKARFERSIRRYNADSRNVNDALAGNISHDSRFAKSELDKYYVDNADEVIDLVMDMKKNMQKYREEFVSKFQPEVTAAMAAAAAKKVQKKETFVRMRQLSSTEVGNILSDLDEISAFVAREAGESRVSTIPLSDLFASGDYESFFAKYDSLIARLDKKSKFVEKYYSEVYHFYGKEWYYDTVSKKFYKIVDGKKKEIEFNSASALASAMEAAGVSGEEGAYIMARIWEDAVALADEDFRFITNDTLVDVLNSFKKSGLANKRSLAGIYALAVKTKREFQELVFSQELANLQADMLQDDYIDYLMRILTKDAREQLLGVGLLEYDTVKDLFKIKLKEVADKIVHRTRQPGAKIRELNRMYASGELFPNNLVVDGQEFKIIRDQRLGDKIFLDDPVVIYTIRRRKTIRALQEKQMVAEFLGVPIWSTKFKGSTFTDLNNAVQEETRIQQRRVIVVVTERKEGSIAAPLSRALSPESKKYWNDVIKEVREKGSAKIDVAEAKRVLGDNITDTPLVNADICIVDEDAWSVLAKRIEEHVFLTRSDEADVTGSVANWSMRSLIGLHSMIRSSLLLSPRYHLNNFYGLLQLSLQMGRNPFPLIKKAIYAYDNIVSALRSGKSTYQDFAGHVLYTINGKRITRAEVMKAYNTSQCAGNGMFAILAAMRKREKSAIRRLPGVGKALGLYADVLDANSNFGSITDDAFRYAAFESLLLEGKSVREAEDAVLKYFYNYRSVTAFERNVVSMFVPFWSFMRMNLLHQAKYAMTHPWVSKAYGRMTVGDEDIYYENLINQGAFPLWPDVDEKGHVTYRVWRFGGRILMSDLAKLGTPQDAFMYFMGSLHPIFKLPIELMTNKQMFGALETETGIEFKDIYSDMRDIEFGKTRIYIEHIARSLIRLYGEVRGMLATPAYMRGDFKDKDISVPFMRNGNEEYIATEWVILNKVLSMFNLHPDYLSMDKRMASRHSWYRSKIGDLVKLRESASRNVDDQDKLMKIQKDINDKLVEYTNEMREFLAKKSVILRRSQ